MEFRGTRLGKKEKKEKREVEKRVKSQQINFFQLGVRRLFATVFQRPFGHFLLLGGVTFREASM